ncbi:MAG: RnfABCDGE type electron transport complex subunit B [Prolixibacteraceae bacterium]|nr:RnfABCDGE type electron transport complex subunit B [Burkholderiales bacterium]
MDPELIEAIDALLPQTQCTKCGYLGCRPYAVALAHGDADINQCPPGGATGIRKLARLLGRAEKPLNPSNGIEAPRAAAMIDESRCIGCTLCIEACPVDAIVGAAKRMHTVLTEACTGCELCLPPCPVDCIDMIGLDSLAESGNRHAASLLAQSVEDMAGLARQRFAIHVFRVARNQEERSQRLEKKARDRIGHQEMQPGSHDIDRKKAAVQAALERARSRRAGQKIS